MTLKLLSMRALLPRRQSTTLPATFAGSSEFGMQSSALACVAPAFTALAASTSGVSGSALVTDAPTIENCSLLPLIVAVELNWRVSVSAPTVVSHGTEAGEPTVPTPGPELPAELATNTPASEAPRKACSSGPKTYDVVPPTE